MKGMFPFSVICWLLGHRWEGVWFHNEIEEGCTRCGKINLKQRVGGGTF